MANSGAKQLNIGVLGGGVMGLSAAYELAKQGHAVTLFEQEDRLGGLAASFDWQGLRLERYYHFICLPDRHYLSLIGELGLKPQLHWRQTKMSYYYNGKHYRFGDPFSLLAFPGLSLRQKLRYGLNVLYAKFFSNWRKLEERSAADWLKGWLGEKTYEILWRTLLELKFWHYADEISAAWIWSRIRRVANSRRALLWEFSGYLEGGTETLLSALAARIKAGRGTILTNAPVAAVKRGPGGLQVRTKDGKSRDFDRVISTIPLPAVAALETDLPAAYRQQVAGIKNIGVICLLLVLKRRLTDNFWLNVKDPRIKLPGLIEYTNLNPAAGYGGRHLLYIPLYLDVSDPLYAAPAEAIFDRYFRWLQMIVPGLERSDVIDYQLKKSRFAQPVPVKGFSRLLPAMPTPVPGFFLADTGHYFPEDRSVDQSILYGQKLAALAMGGKA
ncbi:MAG: NAD(P)/FAD-dependent oxidoreductase [Candidatus Margulisiibacteriota bacterium]